jgi:hypothetical protein
VMMEGIEHDQVVQAGFPAVKPVLYVVPVKEGGVGAPGEGAAAVTQHQGAANGRRNTAGATAAAPSLPISACATRPQSRATLRSVSAETRAVSAASESPWRGRQADPCSPVPARNLPGLPPRTEN